MRPRSISPNGPSGVAERPPFTGPTELRARGTLRPSQLGSEPLAAWKSEARVHPEPDRRRPGLSRDSHRSEGEGTREGTCRPFYPVFQNLKWLRFTSKTEGVRPIPLHYTHETVIFRFTKIFLFTTKESESCTSFQCRGPPE